MKVKESEMLQPSFFEQLRRSNLGYHRKDDFTMHILSSNAAINYGQYKDFQNKGQLFYNVFMKINDLYKAALVNNDRVILDLLETGVLRSKVIRTLHRKLFLQTQDHLPLIFRIDSPDGFQFVDCHVGFRGLGYLYALRNALESHGESGGFFTMKRLTHFADSLWLTYKKTCKKLIFYMRVPEHREVNYFLKHVCGPQTFSMYRKRFAFSLAQSSEGLRCRQIHVSPRDYYDSIKFKRTPLCLGLWVQSALLRDAYDAVSSSLRERCFIEPVPHLLYEQKVIPVLMNHPAYKERFSDEERRLFPDSRLVSQSIRMPHDGKELTLDEIIALPRQKRLFVLKYAGMDLNRDWGGKAVYGLKQETKKGAARLLKMAINSFSKKREPWILQKDISNKESVRYYDKSSGALQKKECYKLFKPYFIKLPESDQVEFMDAIVLFKDTYKVYFHDNSIIGLVSMKKNEK